MQSVKIKNKQNFYDFSINDDYHPAIWKANGDLNEDIRQNLIQIIEDFYKTLKVDTEIEDIRFTGSLANFNYTKFSDIDLHVVLDFDKILDDYNILSDYFKQKKNLWNIHHRIMIKGFEVEIYVEDVDEEHLSTGVYSVMNNEWIVKPEHKVIDIDHESVKRKVDSLIAQIEDAEVPQLAKIKEKIIKMRRSGLEKAGEYSIENLAFKVLRRMGVINQLISKIQLNYDVSLSIEENDTEYQDQPGFKKKYMKNRLALLQRKNKIFPKSAPPLG